MVGKYFASILLVLLSACTGVADWRSFAFGPGQAASATHYSFAWRLSGDRSVAPLQVFDDGRRTWLQFAPQQAVPAIFERSAAGDRPITHVQEGPYVVLPGVWPELILRGGHLKSLIQRAPPSGVDGTQAGADISISESHSVEPVVAVQQEDVIANAAAALTESSFTVDAGGPGSPRYEVGPKDLTLRAVLVKWAQSAGWTFDAEHWAVDADIPVAGSASFDLDFRLAVQELVASTELADRPLQPCFYSNQVLRIVPFAQPCDRSTTTATTT